MNDSSRKPMMNRRTLGKASAATLLAPIYAQMQATAQESTPAASPMTGEMTELTIGTMPLAPGIDAEGADTEAALNMVLAVELATADPQVLYSLAQIEISSKVFAPLLALNENNELVDAGADKVLVSEDGRVYQFHIREGLTYSDGTPCTAKDYAYSIKRALDPVVAGEYSNILFAISGGEAWRSADPEAAETADLKAVVDAAVFAADDQTLEIHLDYAAGYLPYVMTTWISYPVREDLVEGNGDGWWRDINNYVGNGPYVVTEWTEDQQWVFERNETYYRGTPGVKSLVFRIVEAAETRLLAYQQGELDTIDPSAAQLPQISSDATLSEQLHRIPGASTLYMSFNMSSAPFDEKLVRQAFSSAMNREQYIEQVLNGVGIVANTFLYDGVAGYQQDTVQGFDPERAAELLAEAGYPGGEGFPEIQLHYNSESAIAQQQATYWAQGYQQVLNVPVQPTPLSQSELGRVREAGETQMNLSSWFEDYPHPQNWLSLVYGEGSTRAAEGWYNPEFYALVSEADALPIEEATPLYSQADAILADATPAAYFMHGEGLVLIHPKIQGYVTYPTDQMDLRYQIEKIYVVSE